VLVVSLTGSATAHPAALHAAQAPQLFATAIDTMKESHDTETTPLTDAQIADDVNLSASLNPSYITVDTNWDYPGYLQRWVTAIRAAGKHVWFRIHPNAWEGEHGATGLMTPQAYEAAEQAFILANAGLFQPGDILDPCPEPENGLYWQATYGNNWTAGAPNAATADYNAFIRATTSVATQALQQAGVSGVITTIRSLNAYIASQPGILEQATVNALGMITVDSYPEGTTTDPSTAAAARVDELNSVYALWQVPIVIGEMGYSNEMAVDDTTQDQVLAAEFTALATLPYLVGVNYWVGAGTNTSGGYTHIFSGSAGNWSLRPAAAEVAAFFNSYGGAALPTPIASPSVTATDPGNTPTATVTPAPAPPNCELIVLAGSQTIQQGATGSLVFKVLPDSSLTATVLGGSYPATATLTSPAPQTNLTGLAVASPAPGGFQYAFQSGPGGTAVLRYAIPANAPLGQVQVEVTASEACEAPGTVSRTLSFNVEAPQITTFSNVLGLSAEHVVVRSVEPPPAQDSIADERVRIHTAPGASALVSAMIMASQSSSLGTAADGGDAFSNGQVFYSGSSTADAAGILTMTVPLSSTLLVPGQGAVVVLQIQLSSGTATSTMAAAVAIREQRLRLVVAPSETSRGGKRAMLLISKAHGTATGSTLPVLVLADPGAHLSGTFSIAQPPTVSGIAGTGGRAELRFNVPGNSTPGSGTAFLTVSSTFRGATIVRSVSVHYTRRP
jgi:hypothetical protein